MFLVLLAAGLLLVAANTSELPDALEADDVCEGACSLELLQRRGIQVADAADAAFENEVDDIIDDEFKEVTGFGSYFSDLVGLQDTQDICTPMAKLSEVLEMQSFDQIMDAMDLGKDNECDEMHGKLKEDPTCKAIQAASKVMFKLSAKYKQGPKFKNYLLVDWGDSPSWKQGTVQMDWSMMPPRAKVLDPNGANTYGFCDIMVTVLAQTADQQSTSTCGYMAALAALSHKAPAKAIKMGVRLLWTGRPTRLIEKPCPYIFDQQPGIIPYMDENNTWHPTSYENDAVAKGCTGGNAADCEAASGKPFQNSGFPEMWSQSLISSVQHAHDGKCPGNGTGPAKMKYPGQSAEEAEAISDVQGQTALETIWVCNAVIDPQKHTCRMLFDNAICGEINSDDCHLWVTMASSGQKEIDTVFKYVSDDSDNALPLAQALSALKAYKPESKKELGVRSFILKQLELGIPVESLLTAALEFGKPRFTEELLQQACNAHVAMLMIAADAIGLPFDSTAEKPRTGPYYPRGVEYENGTIQITEDIAPGMNHAVYLSDCDAEKDVYTLWTWGTRVYVDKAMLLGQPVSGTGRNTGILFRAVIADKITWGPKEEDMKTINPFKGI